MCRKLTWLTSLVLMLAAGMSAQAAGFHDSFDTPHDYLKDGLGAAGMLPTSTRFNASISREGALYMETGAPVGTRVRVPCSMWNLWGLCRDREGR